MSEYGVTYWELLAAGYFYCYEQARMAMIAAAILGVAVAVVAAVLLYVGKKRNVAIAVALVSMSIGVLAFGIGAVSAAKKRAFLRDVISADAAFAASQGARELRGETELAALQCTNAGGASSAPPLLAGGIVLFLAWLQKKREGASRDPKE